MSKKSRQPSEASGVATGTTKVVIKRKALPAASPVVLSNSFPDSSDELSLKMVTEALPAEALEADTVKEMITGMDSANGPEREALQHIIDLLPCYVVVLDSQKHIRFSNKTFRDYFGQTTGLCHEVLRRSDKPCSACPPFSDFGTSSSCVFEWASQASQTAFRVHCYVLHDSSGERLLLKVGISMNTSLRMRQALDLSESSYRAITDNLSIGIAIIGLDLKVNAGNIRLSKWFGASFCRGARLCDILQCNGPENVPHWPGDHCTDCPFGLVLKDKATHEKEFVVSMQDDAEHAVRVVACPVAQRDGRVRAMVMMLEDITKRISLNRQLQRARNIEAVSAMAGGIAHEINQPLSALNLYASGLQMLLEKIGEVDVQTVSDRLSLIMKESEKISSIIANMRALVMKGSSASLEPVALDSAVDSAVSIMEHQMETRGITVNVLIQKNLPMVHSHPVQLEQVLINLLSNAMHAIDALDSRPNLDPSADPVSRPVERMVCIEAGLLDGGRKVQLTVTDSGIGLPPGKERIFDPFFTTKESAKGMGLGLSIVNGLVNQWGGEVGVKGKDARLGGAAFAIVLNVADFI